MRTTRTGPPKSFSILFLISILLEMELFSLDVYVCLKGGGGAGMKNENRNENRVN